MKQNNFLKTSLAVAIMFAISSCSKNNDRVFVQDKPAAVSEEMMLEKGANPDEAAIKNAAIPDAASRGGGHYLFTESNAAGTNSILKYRILNNGSLQLDETIQSGGAGTGVKLGSQGALVLDKKDEWLYAVNAGSNSVSSFKIHNDGSVALAHTEYTHGTMPVSVTVHGNLLYVLNRGTDNIHGFRIGAGGTLTAIAGSGRPLSGTAVDAPQISFLPGGDWIAVTEKATNKISTYKVKNDGAVNAGIFTASTGQTPFGFEFSRGEFMIVSNASAGAAGAGTATSYITGNNGVPHDINGAKANYQAAPCWVAVTKYGRFAYTTNTASNNISSYYVAPWGGLYLVDGTAAEADMGPLDIVVASNNYHVYALNSVSHTITGYNRLALGGLNFMTRKSNIPDAATGLATF